MTRNDCSSRRTATPSMALQPLALAMLVVATAGPAAAQSFTVQPAPVGYLSAGVGAARIAVDCAGTTSCDRTSAGYRVLGGVRLSERWSAELGWFDWGHADGQALAGTTPIEMRARGTGVGLGLAYLAPLSPGWQAAVRFGLASNRSRLEGSTVVAGLPVSVSDSSRHTQPYLGVGLDYAIDRQWSVEASADFSRLKHSSTLSGTSMDERADTQLLGLSLRYQF
jgi:OmpA-OmpF porin, OOP family